MDKNDNNIHSIPLNNGQKDNRRNKFCVLIEKKASAGQLVAIKPTGKTKAAKVFLSMFLLFSATAIVSVSGQNQSAYAISFGSTKNLSNNEGDSNDPQIEVSGSNVYTVWGDASKGGGDTLFRKSPDAGNTFQSILDLSNNKAGEATEQHIVKQGNNVYVVWSEDGDVFFKRSTNNGASFGSTINLSDDDKTSDTPDIAVIGNNVYVIWTTRDVSTGGSNEVQLFFKRSTDNGQSFSSVKKISGVFEELSSKIAAIGSNVYIAFGAGSEDSQEMFFTRSTNEGSSFSNPVQISNSQLFAVVGGIAAKGNNVYIVWRDNPIDEIQNHVEFKRSTDNGASFGGTKDFGGGLNPSLDVISNNVYVVWEGNGISFKASKDDGASFGSTKILSNSGENPQISSSGTAVRVVWSESVSGNNDILFRASSNEGISFGSAKNLSSNDGDSIDPQIVSSGGSVYVVWSDDTTGNYDILFKKGVD
jgi:hypothetical protein